jgi:hypothetical protein
MCHEKFIDVLCSPISSNVKNETSVTHCVLLALVLALGVWDLSLVVHRYDRLRIAPLVMVLCSKPFRCILLYFMDCCNR